jgi:glycosyltransferase involved in cell wall biosynthesis
MLARDMCVRHSVSVVSAWDKNRTDWLLGTTLRLRSKETHYLLDGVPVHLFALSPFEKIRLVPSVISYYPLMDFASQNIANLYAARLESHFTAVDLVHNVRIGREPLSIASYDLAQKHDIPFVLTPVHHPRWKGWLYRVFHRLYIRAQAVIALTEAEKKILAGLGVKEERIYVTGMGPILADYAHPEVFRTKYGVTSPFVLFLGQHYKYKGFAHVLESTVRVWKKFPETHFVFIGPGIQSSEDVFEQYHDPRIHRLGVVDLQEKTDALAACTLLCVPSVQESFGGVYTEAWSFQKPVIGCPIPAVREVISDGADGYLVTQDHNEIAARIIDLLEHPETALRMGEAGARKVAEQYSWRHLSGLTEEIYRKVT